MEHHLHIVIDYIIPKGFELNKTSEMPGGVQCAFNFIVKNIGDKEFPGGTFEKITAAYVKSSQIQGIYYPKQKIEPIAVNETRQVYTWDAVLVIPGPTWINCKITANDNNPINFYQIEEKQLPMKNVWKNAYFVIDHSTMQIVRLLKSIEKKLDVLVQKDT